VPHIRRTSLLKVVNAGPVVSDDVAVRVLVVEDEPELLSSLQQGLHRRGFVVDAARDGQEALEKAELGSYDVIVLDRELPVVHGDEVCRRLNSSGAQPRIIMLTAAASLDDLTDGLDLGADDYLTKPFRFAELAARLRALGRRGGPPAPALLCHGDLTLDPGRGTVHRSGRPIALTHRELGVLELLMRAEGRIVSAETLLERVWDENADPFTTSVRVIMSRLRRKLGEPPLIETVVGRGYRL
jgi:two-component system, OmpR family, response regulator VanR